MKSARPWAAGAALLALLGTGAAHAQDMRSNTGGSAGGSALGAPIAVPPPPAVAAVPAQPLMPRVVTPASPPGLAAPSAPSAPRQFGPPGGAVPILGSEPGAATPRPSAPPPFAQPGAEVGSAGIRPDQPAAPPQNIWLPRRNAILGVLDKEDGAVSRVAVQVGNSVVQGRLRIKVLACLVRPPDQAPDAAVFLFVKNIKQNQDDASAPLQNAGDGQTLFSGWLLRAEPGASVVNDARDTFRLIACGEAN